VAATAFLWVCGFSSTRHRSLFFFSHRAPFALSNFATVTRRRRTPLSSFFAGFRVFLPGVFRYSLSAITWVVVCPTSFLSVENSLVVFQLPTRGVLFFLGGVFFFFFGCFFYPSPLCPSPRGRISIPPFSVIIFPVARPVEAILL